MAKKKKTEPSILTKEQENELQTLVNKMLDIAADTVDEYKEVDFSELAALSGSITQIHEDSPFLKDIFKGDSWKKVVTHVPKKPTKNDEK